MNHTQLMAFAAVAEAGGFTKAAEKLMVSQPAVSLQVGELEARLGVSLFHRLPRGVKLTSAGQTLLGYARQIASLERDAEAAMAELIGVQRGRLTIGASHTIGTYLLPAVLGTFRQQYPQIELSLEIANTTQVEAMLLESAVDLAFTEGSVRDANLRGELITEDQLVPVAPAKHPLLSRKRITAEMLCREPLILREEGSGTREVFEAALAKLKLHVKPIMSLSSTEAIKRAVAGGIGLTVISRLSLDTELKAGALAIVPVADLTIKRPLRLLRQRTGTDSPAAAAFLKTLRGSLSR